MSGEPVRLPARTTSVREWARRLRDHAGIFAGRLDHWGAGRPALRRPAPVDGDGGTTMADVREVTVRPDRDRTDGLLRRVPGVYCTCVDDVPLTALGRVLADWTGRDTVAVGLEGHGREDQPCSRTSTCPARSAGSPPLPGRPDRPGGRLGHRPGSR